MEDSARIDDRRAAARRTLTTLLITVSALFVGSVLFMVARGNQSAPQGRPVLAVLPFQGPEAEPGRYSGFAEGLAAYFSRADPNTLYVYGPASTSPYTDAGNDPLAVGTTLSADMVLVGREVGRGLGAPLAVELLRVDDGTSLWRREFEVGADVDRGLLVIQVATEVTQVLDLPR